MPDLTYKQLQAAVTQLAKDVTRAAETIKEEARKIDEEATDTARTAEAIGSLRVDRDTIAETREVAKIMAGLSEAVIAYASAGDTTAKTAKAAHDTNHASHDRIQEAVQRSSVGRDIYDVNRQWLTQE